MNWEQCTKLAEYFAVVLHKAGRYFVISLRSIPQDDRCKKIAVNPTGHPDPECSGSGAYSGKVATKAPRHQETQRLSACHSAP